MTQKYAGEIQGRRCRFRVYYTGDPKYWLFCPLDEYGCEGLFRFPVLKKELKPEIKRALSERATPRKTQKKERQPEPQKTQETSEIEVIIVQVITPEQIQTARQKLEDARIQRKKDCFQVF